MRSRALLPGMNIVFFLCASEPEIVHSLCWCDVPEPVSRRFPQCDQIITFMLQHKVMARRSTQDRSLNFADPVKLSLMISQGLYKRTITELWIQQAILRTEPWVLATQYMKLTQCTLIPHRSKHRVIIPTLAPRTLLQRNPFRHEQRKS